MPRTGREQSGTGIYHVMLRGINRQDIFEEPDDYWAFIKILSAVQVRLADDLLTRMCTCHIYAYCLMPNHVHLLLCEKDWKLGEVVKSIAASYAFFYNKKYGRIGHLFQDRFKSEPCNDPEYFMTLFRYIHQNPVKAGLVSKAEEYEYSSWGNDYHGKATHSVCHTQAAINRFGYDELSAWVDMPLPENIGCIDLNERKIVADETVRQLIVKKCGARSISDFQLYSKERQKDIVHDVMIELGAGPRQLSRVTGLSYTLIYKLGK
jgi:REP element-mobilizing transposase RayT